MPYITFGQYFSTAHESPLKTKKPAQAHLRGIQQHDYRLDSGISPPTECSCAASAVNFPKQIKQESQEGTYSHITFSYLREFAHVIFSFKEPPIFSTRKDH